MHNKLRNVLLIVLAVAFVTGAVLLVRQEIGNREAEDAIIQAQALATTPLPTVPETTAPLVSEEETVPETEPMDEGALKLSQINIAPLQEVNPDVIGWIYLPGTQISYPLLHGPDNSTYLSTTWRGEKNVAGSIFLETRNRVDLKDFHTIIYGHHMRAGTMFAALMGYKEAAFRESHPHVYIATEFAVRKYTVFSAYEAAVKSDTYRLVFKDDAKKREVLQFYRDSSVWESGIIPTEEDAILTLSTCTGLGDYDYRWVVQAVLTDQWEK